MLKLINSSKNKICMLSAANGRVTSLAVLLGQGQNFPTRSFSRAHDLVGHIRVTYGLIPQPGRRRMPSG
jgi:hypothetical protein